MELLVILKIIIAVVLAVSVGVMIYMYIRDLTLEDIRVGVYKLFLEAEHTYLHTGTGLQKMEYVIQRARSMLPIWAQFFVTEDVLRKVVQMWFDGIKDLLDDGKMNRSVEELE